jgi:hypothetical protein
MRSAEQEERQVLAGHFSVPVPLGFRRGGPEEAAYEDVPPAIRKAGGVAHAEGARTDRWDDAAWGMLAPSFDAGGRECQRQARVELHGDPLALLFSSWHPGWAESWERDDYLESRNDERSRILRALKSCRGFATRFTTIRSGKRAVAGFQGSEDVIQLAYGRLVFRWTHLPQPGVGGYQPRIEIVGEGDYRSLGTAVECWDLFLDGIRYLASDPG